MISNQWISKMYYSTPGWPVHHITNTQIHIYRTFCLFLIWHFSWNLKYVLHFHYQWLVPHLVWTWKQFSIAKRKEKKFFPNEESSHFMWNTLCSTLTTWKGTLEIKTFKWCWLKTSSNKTADFSFILACFYFYYFKCLF